MKTITANEIFYAFAKLQLWFHMSHFYRQPGFYDGVDEMIEMFAGADPDAAYNIIIDRFSNVQDSYLWGKDLRDALEKTPSNFSVKPNGSKNSVSRTARH